MKTARIRICQGCRIPLQSDCQAPINIVVNRLEYRPYKHDGVTKTPTVPSNSHYHVNMQCILSTDPTFVSHKLVIPEAVHVYLTPIHKQFLLSALGIVIQWADFWCAVIFIYVLFTIVFIIDLLFTIILITSFYLSFYWFIHCNWKQ